MPIIETRNLCKRYGTVMRVTNLALQVPEGSIYGFLGPNGAGKSTTMNIMTGGGPGNATKTLVNYIYEKAFTSWQLGPASAGAIILFAVVLVITLIQFTGEKKWSKDLM